MCVNISFDIVYVWSDPNVIVFRLSFCSVIILSMLYLVFLLDMFDDYWYQYYSLLNVYISDIVWYIFVSVILRDDNPDVNNYSSF